jgi:hypothetical protein
LQHHQKKYRKKKKKRKKILSHLRKAFLGIIQREKALLGAVFRGKKRENSQLLMRRVTGITAVWQIQKIQMAVNNALRAVEAIRFCMVVR